MFGMDVVKKFGARSCVVALLLALAGCQGYTVVQRNVFADDNGNIVAVDYGRSERDHVNTFVSPDPLRDVRVVSDAPGPPAYDVREVVLAN